MNFKILLFCILTICLVSHANAASYNAETDIATATSADSLEDIWTAVGDENLFAKNGLKNYTMNISEITITSGSFIMDSDVLFFDCETDNDTHFDIGGNGLIIRNNSIITSVNSSTRGSFISHTQPGVFTVINSIMDGFYKISFHNYGVNETFYIDNSTLKNYNNIFAFEGLKTYNSEYTDWEDYAIQSYGEGEGNWFHNVSGVNVFQYGRAGDSDFFNNNTFSDFNWTSTLLFAKERTTYMEITGNYFKNVIAQPGTSAPCIDLYLRNSQGHVYKDEKPIWVHNNTFENVTLAFYLLQNPWFIIENNSVYNSTTGLYISSNYNSNSTTPSLFQNNLIKSSDGVGTGISFGTYDVNQLNLKNNTYNNLNRPYYFRNDFSSLTFDNESFPNSDGSYIADEAKYTLTNPVLPFKTGFLASGGTMSHYNGLITLASHSFVTFIRNGFSANQSNIEWNDVETYDYTGKETNYTISNLYTNYNYTIYKDGVLIDTVDSGASGEVEFYSDIATTPGNVFVINTTLLSGMRYNSATPFINTIDESGTVTGYSRTLNPDTDSSSNLRVIPQ